MKKIIILIPVYNDWQSTSKLLEDINLNVKGLNQEFSVIIVNDASTDQQSINSTNLENLSSISINIQFTGHIMIIRLNTFSK